MLGKCKRCGTGSLTSFFEQRLEACADCVAVMVDKCRLFESDMPGMQEELSRLKMYNETLEKTQAAENAGNAASQKGLAEDQNPFSDPAEKMAWNFGWSRGELDRRTTQAIAVIQWAVLNLDLIENLCAGYGYDEITRKLEHDSEKLADFVEVG